MDHGEIRAMLMSEKQVRRLPVVIHDKRLVGIVALAIVAALSLQMRRQAFHEGIRRAFHRRSQWRQGGHRDGTHQAVRPRGVENQQGCIMPGWSTRVAGLE